ncbi:DUF1918 domain-containing protein [Streptomyces hoynatensis]|uniref:DUF1918 domain-containing protein n=1 Tax=Streptomyces hoynatensis TaxID=1141874 RepID=A0A3A9YQ56_9ACTN|nr:DUF1918 domain-containing protein [Streptomyces hoynatensis]RKN38148.1 DUF1918 domain-containing protein [Streptomyces hoynatensis]
MQAKTGDRVVTHGRTVGQNDQVSEIVEVLGRDGEPPYRVRSSDGTEKVLSPGPDSVVERGKRRWPRR